MGSHGTQSQRHGTTTANGSNHPHSTATAAHNPPVNNVLPTTTAKMTAADPAADAADSTSKDDSPVPPSAPQNTIQPTTEQSPVFRMQATQQHRVTSSDGSLVTNNTAQEHVERATTTPAESASSSTPTQQRLSNRRISSGGSMSRTTSMDSVVRDWSQVLDVHATMLDLSNHSLRTEQMYSLVQTLLEQCTHVQILDLSGNHLGSRGMEKLQPLLRHHPALREVKLARNALKGRRALRYLCDACKANDGLRVLDVSHNQLSDDAVRDSLATLLDTSTDDNACRLATLDLSHNTRLTARVAWELGGALVSGHNTTLKILHLSGNALGPTGGDALGTLLKLSGTLEALHVANCNLGDDGVQYICQGLRMNTAQPALRVLNVAWNVLHCQAAVALSEMMPHVSTLTRLQLECNGICDTGAAALAKALPRSSLQVLDVRGNQIHDAGAIALAVALTNAACQSLELHWEMNAHMTAVGRHRIQGALQLRTSRRQWLDALLQSFEGMRRYPPLNREAGDDEVVEICQHVETQQKLHAVTLPVVRLSGQGITLRGVKAIANKLLCPASVTLTHLYFVHTSMGNDGANLLAQALLRNQSLTALTCMDCQWTEEGALYLSRALPRHTHLQRLDLRDNRIGTEGARALLHAITEETPNLHTLYLGRNQIGDLAVRYLASMGHLNIVNLADNELTDAAALDLARVCGNISTAGGGTMGQTDHSIRLDLRRNYLTGRGIQALELFLSPSSKLDTGDQHSLEPLAT